MLACVVTCYYILVTPYLLLACVVAWLRGLLQRLVGLAELSQGLTTYTPTNKLTGLSLGAYSFCFLFPNTFFFFEFPREYADPTVGKRGGLGD